MEFILLASYSWALGLPWGVVDITSETPSEKTDFPFASWYQSASRFLASEGILCLLPLGVGTTGGLNLAWVTINVKF